MGIPTKELIDTYLFAVSAGIQFINYNLKSTKPSEIQCNCINQCDNIKRNDQKQSKQKIKQKLMWFRFRFTEYIFMSGFYALTEAFWPINCKA